MKVSVQNLIIDKDMVLKVSKQVWPWEVPVLQAKHGEGKVRLTDTAEIEVKALPQAGAEFDRLLLAHGTDAGEGGTNMAYAELAYGRGRPAITALAKAIKASGKKRPRKKATAKKPEPAVEAGDGGGDPLDF